MSENILQFLVNPEMTLVLILIKMLFILFSLFFMVFIVYVLFVTRWFKLLFWYDFVEFFTQKIYGGVLAGIKWRIIRFKSKNANVDKYSKYIVKGHDIMDKLLERLAPVYSADSYGERLARTGQGTFSNVTDVWWAHELYRDVKNKKFTTLSSEEFEKLIKTYNQAFKDLGVI